MNIGYMYKSCTGQKIDTIWTNIMSPLIGIDELLDAYRFGKLMTNDLQYSTTKYTFPKLPRFRSFIL